MLQHNKGYVLSPESHPITLQYQDFEEEGFEPELVLIKGHEGVKDAIFIVEPTYERRQAIADIARDYDNDRFIYLGTRHSFWVNPLNGEMTLTNQIKKVSVGKTISTDRWIYFISTKRFWSI